MGPLRLQPQRWASARKGDEIVALTDDELFKELERELFAAHEGTPDLATIDRL